MKSLFKTGIFLFTLLCGVMFAAPESVKAARMEPTAEEYTAQKEKLMGLLEYLRTSPYLVWPKNFTVEDETGINNGLKKYFSDSDSDYTKVLGIMNYVRKHYPGANESQKYLYIADICRLKQIPCFVLQERIQDDVGKVILTKNYRVAFYANDRWYVAYPYFDNEDIYEMVNGEYITTDGIFPTDVYFYDEIELTWIPSSITVDMNMRKKYTSGMTDGNAPCIAYDSEANMVKAYYANGTVGEDEPFMTTGKRTDENGCPPSGWIYMDYTKDNTDGTSTTYRRLGYSFHGIFLKGRLEKDGTEYDLENSERRSVLPFAALTDTFAETAEHSEFRKSYMENIVAKTKRIADALLADPDFIWDEVHFDSEEDEQLVRDAVATALDVNYIKESPGTLARLKSVGIDIDSEDPENLSDKAKAQAILGYVRKNIEPLESGPLFVDSACVLKGGGAICGGMALLVRDMCVIAGIPCFNLGCSMEMTPGDTFFFDHGYDMLKVGGEWLFTDCMGTGRLGSAELYGYYPAMFRLGHVTGDGEYTLIDFDECQRNRYSKWDGVFYTNYYFDFDENGKLARYYKDLKNKPIIIKENALYKGTDAAGKILLETGLNYADFTEKMEDGTGEVVNRYAFYYQYGHYCEGKRVINGRTYDFQTATDSGIGFLYSGIPFQKMEEVSRRYYIGKMDVRPIPGQDYTGEDVCPVPEIYHGDKKLELHRDFELEYENNRELSSAGRGNARVTIRGIGDYHSSHTIREFEIVKPDISKMKATLSQTEFVWSPDGMANRPDVSIDLDDKEYTVVYKDYNDVGTASVEITGKNHHTGKITLNYEIRQLEMDEKHFVLKHASDSGKPLQGQEYTYHFSPVLVEPDVCYTDDDGRNWTLSSKYFEFTYSGSGECGDVTVTATAKDGEEFTGSVSATYRVTPFTVRKSNVELAYVAVDYDGTVKKPNVRKLPHSKMVEGEHFTLTYERKTEEGYVETEPVEPGEYRVGFRAVGDNVKLDEETLEKDGTPCYYYTYWILESPLWTPPDPTPTPPQVSPIPTPTAAAQTTLPISMSPTPTAATQTPPQVSSSPTPVTTAETTPHTTAGPTPTATTGTISHKPSVSPSSAPSASADTKGKTGTSYHLAFGVSGQTELISNAGSDAVKKLKISAKKKSLKITWSKVKSAKKYYVQVSLKKNFFNANMYEVKKTKTSYTIKKLKAKKKYYVRIRAYLGTAKAGEKKLKKYGKWKQGSQKTR